MQVYSKKYRMTEENSMPIIHDDGKNKKMAGKI